MRITRGGTGGPPLFFVHGFACDRTDWHAQVDSLETRNHRRRVRVARAWNEPGHTGAECTIEAYGAAVARQTEEPSATPI
jgi:pimeloyl-ACP methyl ester carboxylesterase